jgi:hypothetical protein
MEIELVEKSRRGRKKKPVQDIQVKKRRGRKLAVDYYSTSACQKEMSKPSSIISNTILQLNVDTKEVEDSVNLETFNIEEHKRFKISQEFKKMQELKNDTILEDYLNAGSVGSLEEIYKSKLNNRREQDDKFIKTLTEYYNGGIDGSSLDQKESDIFENIEPKKTQENIKSTMIDTLDTTNINIKNITILKDIVNKDWPTQTSTKCWWCCHNFNTVPIGVPIKYMKKQDIYQVRGVYCSIACMYSGSKQEDTCKEKKSMVKAFYNRLTNGSICDELISAPPREVLKDFGGDLTINQFRELSKNRNVYKTIKYPMILREDIVNVSDVEKMKNVHKKLTNNKTGIKIVDKPLQKTTIETLLDIEYEDE